MKTVKDLILFALLGITTSCQFHLVKNPGPQISSSISESKNNNTFICQYRLSNKTINGVKIACAFAEKKYSSDGGLFSHYDINCCKSQLVIVSSSYLASDGKGFDITWKMRDFNLFNGKIIYRDYNTMMPPDSISLNVVAIKARDSTEAIGRFVLYKAH